MQGAGASGAATVGNPVKVGGVYRLTLPTLTDGQSSELQVSAIGLLRVQSAVLTSAASDGYANTRVGFFRNEANTDVVGTQVIGSVYNGSTWDRMRGDASNGLVVQSSASEYESVAASQTDQILGATGAVGDLVDSLLIIPATTSPGNVQIKDGNGTAITVFTGGASSVSSLVPFSVPLGLKAVNATTPGWKVTTGANVSVIGIGNFT